MDNLLLSIIIVHYNTYDLTHACIKSIFENTYDLNLEIILVDNASTDRKSSDFLEDFEALHIIQSPNNLGFSKANNLGIQHAKGQFIVLLNSDTYLIENAFQKAIDRFNQLELRGFLGLQLRYPDGRIQHSAQRFPSMKIELIELFRVQKILGRRWASKQLLGSYFDHQTEQAVDWVWGTCILFEKKILELLPEGKLSDQFFMYGEDMDWGMQIRKAGYKVWYSPLASVVHIMAGSAINKNRFDLMQKHEKKLMIQWYGHLATCSIYLVRVLKHVSRCRKSSIKEALSNWKMLWY